MQFGGEQLLERAGAGVGAAEVLHLVADADGQFVEVALVVVVPEAGDELLNLGQRDLVAHDGESTDCVPR